MWNVGTLVGTMTLMAVAFRAATHDSEMLHLMVSVLFSMVLPVIVVCESIGRPVVCLQMSQQLQVMPFIHCSASDGASPQ